jgi:hypothetical protein
MSKQLDDWSFDVGETEEPRRSVATEACCCATCAVTDPKKFKAKDHNECRNCASKRKIRLRYPKYDEIVKAQGGEICQLCERTPKECRVAHLWFDFDEKTGWVRGLVCRNCLLILQDLDHLRNYLRNPPIKEGMHKVSKGALNKLANQKLRRTMNRL